MSSNSTQQQLISPAVRSPEWFFGATPQGIIPQWEAHIYMALCLLVALYITTLSIILMLIHCCCKNKITKARQTEYMILSAAGEVLLCLSQIPNAYFYPVKTYPTRSWGIVNFLLFNLGNVTYLVPGIVRVWRIVCFHSTTVSFRFTKTKFPYVFVELTRMGEMKIRGHAWMLKRIVILYIPWLLGMASNYGLAFSSFFRASLFYEILQYTYSLPIIGVVIWLVCIKSRVIVKEIVEWRSLIVFSIVFSSFLISTRVLFYFVLPPYPYLVRLFILLIISFHAVNVSISVGWTIISSTMFVYKTKHQKAEAAAEEEETVGEKLEKRAMELEMKDGHVKLETPASSAITPTTPSTPTSTVVEGPLDTPIQVLPDVVDGSSTPEEEAQQMPTEGHV